MSAVSQALRDGIAAAQAQQFERARPLLQQVTMESPGDPTGWFWLAIVSPAADAAIPCLRRVLEIDPSHDQARAALAKLLMTEAGSLASAGNRGDARELVTEASQLTPGAQAVWLALAALTDDQNERLHALRQAVAIRPDDPQVRTRLRQALLLRGVMLSADRAGARACFREAAALDPSDPRVWQALANLADTPAETVDALRDLLRIVPNHANGRIALRNALVADAQALSAGDRIDAACERWHEAIALTGGDVETWLGLAAITSNQEEAVRAVETAYKLNPADEGAAAAMDRLRASQVDPASVVPPADAFTRFDAEADPFAPVESADDPLAQLDSSLDALAELAVTVPPPQAVAKPVPPVLRAAAPAAQPVRAVPEREKAPKAQTPIAVPVVAAPVKAAPVSAAPEAALAAPASPAAAPDSPAPVAPVAASNGSSRRTVMIVDDSPTIRKILGLTLERAGYKVVAEPDGESAIERLIQVVPDLILLDIAMPKLDGYEVCKRIKQDPRTANVPVVMLSGKGAFFDKVKGHMAGATEYLTKPFETPAVLAVVTSYCQPSPETVNG